MNVADFISDDSLKCDQTLLLKYIKGFTGKLL